jgi:hypothetical protein
MSSSVVQLLLTGAALGLLQLLAAVPWLYALDPKLVRASIRRGTPALSVLGAAAGIGAAGLWFLASFLGDPARIEFAGRVYGAVLHGQVTVDAFVVFFAVLLLAWPKGGAVAQAAFREGLRQPMFWLLATLAWVLLVVSIVIPYFTFGDDYKMMKQIAYDIIMLAPTIFCVIVASTSINEEIEGKTAVTLMSKPITRRQFLLGKYVGTLAAGWAMTMLVGWWLNWALQIQPFYNRLDDVNDTMPKEVAAVVMPIAQAPFSDLEVLAFVKGGVFWLCESFAFKLGMILNFGQVMVLLAIAVALATRLPFVANIVIVLVMFFLGHLSPILAEVSRNLRAAGGVAALDLVAFLARLFETILPPLEFNSTSLVVIRENPIPLLKFMGYVVTVTLNSLLYSTIALLFGLIFFEDRDLA